MPSMTTLIALAQYQSRARYRASPLVTPANFAENSYRADSRRRALGAGLAFGGFSTSALIFSHLRIFIINNLSSSRK